MKKFGSYFKEHFSSGFMTLLFVSIISVVLSFVFGFTGQVGVGEYRNASLGFSSFVIMATAYFVPVLEFSPFKKRRNLDCFYALPISRRAMGLVHYLTGLITVTVPYVLAYLTNFLLLLRFLGGFELQFIVPHFFLVLLFGVINYTVMVFAFNEANSTNDGVAFMFFWNFLPGLLCGAVESRLGVNLFSYYGIGFMPESQITASYSAGIEKEAYLRPELLWESAALPVWIAVWCVIAVLALLGFVFFFGRKRTEKAEEISDSFFGYRVLIPLMTAAIMLSMDLRGEIFAWLMFEILALVGYTVYRRGFHYKMSDLIVLLALAVFLVI